nr:MAG TPA_asm: hypothetical protein [Caudoviricetes sp.]
MRFNIDITHVSTTSKSMLKSTEIRLRLNTVKEDK